MGEYGDRDPGGYEVGGLTTYRSRKSKDRSLGYFIEAGCRTTYLLNILLASSISGLAGGGTAAYVRTLGNELVAKGHRLTAVSRLKSDLSIGLRYEKSDFGDSESESQVRFDGWKCDLVKPRLGFRFPLSQLDHFIWRNATQRLAISTFSAAFKRCVEQVLPADLDVVHYTGAGAELFGFVAAQVARGRGVPFTVTPFVHPRQWGDSAIDIKLYNQSDRVFVCTQVEGDHLCALGLSPNKVVVSPMAPIGLLDGSGDRFRKRFGLEGRRLILFLGRRQRYKGFHLLCEAVNELLGSHPDLLFVVAGTQDEPPFPGIPEVNILDLGELTPSQADSQVKADALAACDIYCMPSSGEAFGLVYAEAWHFGKPVIGGPAPALKELISDGNDGLIVPQDRDRLVEALDKLLKDEALRQRLGNNGKQKQRTRFTWNAVLDCHLKAWSDVS